ncbi:hypothetical protein [Pasteuria penetrans]|uniref:hypothetical protein n=1 Tax=Pasteuria penetrans TaxID=86005 RepID=UPI000FBD8B0D|nr:hypothetical protein [Pasteuria penetrans]
MGVLFSLPKSTPEWLVFSGFLLSLFLLCFLWAWPTLRSLIVLGLGLDSQRYAHFGVRFIPGFQSWSVFSGLLND